MTKLWGLQNGEDANPMLSCLDAFVSSVDRLNEKFKLTSKGEDPGIQLVSRGSSHRLPPHQPIQTAVFYGVEPSQVVIVLSQENIHIDAVKIRNLFDCELEDGIVPVPDDEVLDLCGFPQETLPPVGNYFPSNASSPITVIDESLLKACQDNDLLVLGEAGYPLWKTLVSTDFLLQLEGVMVADVSIASFSNTSTTAERLVSIPEKPSRPKPLFPIEGPPLNLAKLISQQNSIANPLNPTVVNVVGRIGKIKTRTKKSLTCEFLPPPRVYHHSTKRNRRRDLDETFDEDDDLFPWRSASNNGIDFKVELSVGRPLFQRLGTSQGEALIENLQTGQMIQIEAQTNPGQRESLRKWVECSSLDLVLMDCEFLYSNKDSSIRLGSNMNTKQRVNGSGTISGTLPSLSLDNLFNESISIHLVDDLDSIIEFSDIVSKELLDKDCVTLAGIDCEWQPTESMEKKNEPQPVLLLQICLIALRRVYLFDLQTILRPLLSPSYEMNEIERALSNALFRFMESQSIMKVGYQVSSDLRRTAASYPHIPCFREVHSVMEVAGVIKRVLQVSKQKKSRYITMSLASMTSYYLGMALNKQCQLSNWSLRPLHEDQIEYASLDAAISPVLVERALESIGARISTNHLHAFGGPVIERQAGDVGLSKEIVSWQFLCLESADEQSIKELQAKQIVGTSWIASSSWINNQSPSPLSAPEVK